MSHLRRFWISLTLLACVGCCSVAPRADKFFHKKAPEESVRMFRYSVEAGQWDFAYGCLTTELQEQYSQLELSLMVRFGSQQGENLRDLIENALQLEGSHAIPGADPLQSRSVTVVFFSDPEDPATDSWEQALFLTKEGDEWRIDLTKDPALMQNFSGDLPPPRFVALGSVRP